LRLKPKVEFKIIKFAQQKQFAKIQTMTQEFLGNSQFQISNQLVSASCPSNIALIKYWGKYENQIPANPSISYTLNHCRTNTTMEFFAGEDFSVQTFLSGNEEKNSLRKLKNISKILSHICLGF
jgi:diphosphomevalonate decarboxylase